VSLPVDGLDGTRRGRLFPWISVGGTNAGFGFLLSSRCFRIFRTLCFILLSPEKSSLFRELNSGQSRFKSDSRFKSMKINLSWYFAWSNIRR